LASFCFSNKWRALPQPAATPQRRFIPLRQNDGHRIQPRPQSASRPLLPRSFSAVIKFDFYSAGFDTYIMLLSKEYVGYLARQVVKRLQANHFIQTREPEKVIERVQNSMAEELSLEDRINDEVRVILEAYSDEMRNRGANYQEMFKKVKNELVKKYKAVL
jgi:hypothetical protein